MAGEHVNELHQLYFAGRHGFLVNSNDGIYQRGKSYGMETKLFVAARYLDHKERLGGLSPVLTKVAAECHVGWDFVAKIERKRHHRRNRPPPPLPGGGSDHHRTISR